MKSSKAVAYMGYAVWLIVLIASFLMDKELQLMQLGTPVVFILFGIYLELSEMNSEKE